MKNWKYILILIGAAFTSHSALGAEPADSLASIATDSIVAVLDSTAIPLADPITLAQPDSIKGSTEMKRKRYKRGLKNYLFIPKKEWIAGLTVSYGEFDMKDNTLLIYLNDLNLKGNITTLNPFVGYFIRDNQCVGIKLGYNHLSANIDNIDINISEDMQFHLNNMRYIGETFSAAIFHRSYIGVDKGKRFGFFNETELALSSGTSRFIRTGEEHLKNTKTTTSEIKLGLNPGACVFIMNNVSASVSFGVAGLRYGTIKQSTNGEEMGYRRSSSADFKINLLNINIGMCLHI